MHETETELITPWDFAERIEQALRDTGREGLIPAGGLGAWVAAAWPPNDDDRDAGSWADDWADRVDGSREVIGE